MLSRPQLLPSVHHAALPVSMTFSSIWCFTRSMSYCRPAHHVDDYKILHNDYTTQHFRLMNTACICWLFHDASRCADVLRQSLSAVAPFDNYHRGDTVHNALSLHRIDCGQPTLSKCTTTDIAAAHCMTILSWSLSWRVGSTMCTMFCLPDECWLIGQFLISAQPKICKRSLQENCGRMFIMICIRHCVYHTKSFLDLWFCIYFHILILSACNTYANFVLTRTSRIHY